MKNKNIDEAFELLWNAKTNEIWAMSELFVKTFGKEERTKTIEYLIKYADKATIHKDFIIKYICELVQMGENRYAEFFRWAINQGLAYYAVEGLIKAEGEKAYPFLVDFIQKTDKEKGGKAVIMLAKYSGQPFDYDLPNDPAYWKTLPIDDLLKWQQDGYPQLEPKEEIFVPLIQNPQTELDFVMQKLEKKLIKERKKWRVGSWEYNRTCLETPDYQTIEKINKQWQLPELYLEFLQKYSPKNYLFSKMITLYGAQILVDRQEGYAWDSSGEKFFDWDENWVVIADREADPYIIDLSKIGNGDCPIYKAPHGAGIWKFKKIANGFLDFLNKL